MFYLKKQVLLLFRLVIYLIVHILNKVKIIFYFYLFYISKVLAKN